jgi:hypothetical protein
VALVLKMAGLYNCFADKNALIAQVEGKQDLRP